MPNKAQAALSTNLAILSQALEQSQAVKGRGVRDVRMANPTAGRGSDASHTPVLIRNREQTGEGPFKTFGRNVAQYFGASTGIQTQRMREDYERQQAEAGVAYQQQQEDERALAGNLTSQVYDDVARLQSFGNAALDTLAANIREDVDDAAWLYENSRDPDMRNGALKSLQALQDRANKELKDFTDAAMAESRVFAREEMKDMRRSINGAQSDTTSRIASARSIEARLALIGRGEIEANSKEGQAILVESMQQMVRFNDSAGTLLSAAGGALGGGAAGSMAGPWGAALGAALGVVGSVLTKEGEKLDYSSVLKAFYAQQKALDEFTWGNGDNNPGLVPQLEQSLLKIEDHARKTLGMTIDDSWRSTRFQFPAPPRLPEQPRAQGALPPTPANTQDNTADYLRRRADRIDQRSQRPTR
jgi:hypothetical protein